MKKLTQLCRYVDGGEFIPTKNVLAFMEMSGELSQEVLWMKRVLVEDIEQARKYAERAVEIFKKLPLEWHSLECRKARKSEDFDEFEWECDGGKGPEVCELCRLKMNVEMIAIFFDVSQGESNWWSRFVLDWRKNKPN